MVSYILTFHKENNEIELQVCSSALSVFGTLKNHGVPEHIAKEVCNGLESGILWGNDEQTEIVLYQNYHGFSLTAYRGG